MVTAITVAYSVVIKRMHDRVQKVNPLQTSISTTRYMYSSQNNENTKSICASVRSSIPSNEQSNKISSENPCLIESSETITCSKHQPNTALNWKKSVSEQSKLEHTRQSTIKNKYELRRMEVRPCVSMGIERQSGLQTKSDKATITRIEKSSGRKKRFRNNVITLGAIIVITYVSVLPKCVLSSIMLASPGLMLDKPKLHLIKGFLLFNSLLDPYIYILRIKEFREKLKLCS
ncbi:unnamed protein product [Mytilus coruscus]|uniref:G-protein coupled receptors family 1 profile domain-containing protein n=1 Tax=Mytilus coruscus TaxID=42192 RepID=A0A6J8ALT0_MYTCO|nr:unnamed protein product [Mytilus coruscus]